MKMIATTVLLATLVSGCSPSKRSFESNHSNGPSRTSLAVQAIVHSGDSQSDIQSKLRSLR